jgi:tryptophan synthase alpha chain
MNRIQNLFRNKSTNILSVFYTAGFPKQESTVAIAQWLEAAGVDLIEIGIPFSDPVADGPAIQESNKIALQNGMNLILLLEQVKQIRQHVKLPILLMGYLNPVLQYGFEKFCKDCKSAGVDGLILPDLPVDVYQSEYKEYVEQNNLCNTFLISPTTSESRIQLIDSLSNSFIYAVSASSTTGAKKDFDDSQISYFLRIKNLKMKNPFLIGFGISNQSTFEKACKYGSGAIVGSAFISLIKNSNDLSNDIPLFIQQLKG